MFQEVTAALSVGEEDTHAGTDWEHRALWDSGHGGYKDALVCEKGITLYVLGPSLQLGSLPVRVIP